MPQSSVQRHVHPVLAAIASLCLLVAGPAFAGQISLQGVTGNSCAYNAISVDAAGTMIVTCSATPPPAGAAGTFSISSNGITLP
jgi:hypothetical protein